MEITECLCYNYTILYSCNRIENFSRADKMAETFANRIKRKMGEYLEPKYTGGKYGGKAYPHILKDKKEYVYMKHNFIDGKVQKNCVVKGSLTDKPFPYHTYSLHLNSSQIMCVNFFRKFFEKEEWEELLLQALNESGAPLSGAKIIKNAAFEYEPNPDEGTNFDFYIEFESKSHESHIFIEVKYTESGFGGTTKTTDYNKRWDEVYKDMAQASFCSELKEYSKEEFFSNFQINRNICYATNTNDIVLFITPEENSASGIKKGREYIDSLHKHNPRILNIYWENLTANLMKLISYEPEYEDLYQYYSEFNKKYIDILKT